MIPSAPTDENANMPAPAPGDLPSCQPQLLSLLDRLVDVLFCMKEPGGTYIAVNEAFVRRTGRSSKRDVIGGRADDFFPAPLAERYAEQDRKVLESGQTLRDELELIRATDGSLGWYVTTKSRWEPTPTYPAPGVVTISRDLRTPSDDDDDALALSRVVEHVRANLDRKVSVDEMATVAGLTPAKLDRRMRNTFGLSPSKYLTRARVNRAADLLADPDVSLADVAVRAGFYDQANLTHQFARLTGETPAQFRAHSLRRTDRP